MKNPVEIVNTLGNQEGEITEITPYEATKLRESGSLSSIWEHDLTIIIIFFGLISLILFYIIVRSGKADAFILRIYVVIILIFGTLLVLSSSYGTDQIAPVVGLFGTIAGYLLGKTEKANEPTSINNKVEDV